MADGDGPNPFGRSMAASRSIERPLLTDRRPLIASNLRSEKGRERVRRRCLFVPTFARKRTAANLPYPVVLSVPLSGLKAALPRAC